MRKTKSLVLGGTGTLGKALAKRLYEEGHEVTIVSRDEFKLSVMKKSWPDFKYGIGDIRDKSSVEGYFAGKDNVFHCAALKQVDMGEGFPHEFAKTNYFGTVNTVDLAVEYGISHYCFFSTDKAVLPINAYGQSKALAESYIRSRAHFGPKMRIYRWGNILGSRGSVLSLWLNLMRSGNPIPITNPEMTRFWLTIEDALDFVMDSYEFGEETVKIPDLRASKITLLVAALAQYCDCQYKIDIIGTRPGEKIHETIYTSHEYCIRSDTAPQYTIPELIELIKRSGV